MSADLNSQGNAASPVVVVGIACRVPGADSVEAFAKLLYEGRTGYGDLPPDRCDRSLYYDPRKGRIGTSYTTLGGIVPERTLGSGKGSLPGQSESLFDPAHRQFAEVAASAWQDASLTPHDGRFLRTGVFVGHSGGTKSGGGLSLGTQIEEALSFLNDIESYRQAPAPLRNAVLRHVTQAVRETRPFRQSGAIPNFNAYQAAALAAKILGLTGPRAVIDAACASSLVALAQAIMAIRTGRIDSAVVGGATYNNVDNLILFSHSQACTATDSRPFDDQASGLVSSEGYVAIVITTEEKAAQLGLRVRGIIRGVGMASDGKGRSLWAPRMEGQVLALQRAYVGSTPLDIDYMEAHATSTQLGDATELETLRRIAQEAHTPEGRPRLLLGSVKSNIGHTLEAAGLIGLVKILIAMDRGQIPPSLRYEKPNHNYDWSTAPVRVVSKTEPWPDTSGRHRARRAAVSAFGIGGLNAHVVIEDSSGLSPAAAPGFPAGSGTAAVLSAEPIAIVGRGIVVAGANNLAQFRTLMESPRSAIIEAPLDRWRNHAGLTVSESPQTYSSPTCRGGFITDFVFDGTHYRIPPRQVQQSNPVQMMLIDAVAQALADLHTPSSRSKSQPENQNRRGGINDFPMDRQRIGVVIGTIFGGEFGDQLQVGMRLPEICRHLMTSLQEHGVSEESSQDLANEYRQLVLKNRPALLDETGSFTSSTLASRVAKTFDLMGGACALDSDDASGLAALSVAADQLRSGLSDMIVCGSAQRSMSLSAFESLDMNNRLARSGRAEDVPDDCRHIVPGEGVVALLLCRLSDAQRLNLPIHGLIGFEDRAAAVDVTHDPSLGSTHLNSEDARIVRKIGYLCGTHSLVRITAETLRRDPPSAPITIESCTNDGILMQTPFRRSVPSQPPMTGAFVSKEFLKAPISFENSVFQSPLPSRKNAPLPAMKTPANESDGRPVRRFRFAATSGSLLSQLLKESVTRADRIFTEFPERIVRDPSRAMIHATEYRSDDTFRTSILAASPEQFQARLLAAVKATEAGKFRTILDRERVILWQTQEPDPRVAWLFPGQGSHYPEMPAVFSASESARQVLSQVDELFMAHNLPRLSDAFGNSSIRPGEDIWWAQGWILGVSAALAAALKAEGLSPDAVLGHSFGEFTAALASGVTTLPQTVELAQHRASAVMAHLRAPGGLLSVRAVVHHVDAILKSAALPVYVTHLNSPKQTVIAGTRDGIAAAKTLLDSHGLASMAVAVPAPFHTPLLAEAERAFENLAARVPMRPPVCGFLSATNVQYLAEPSNVRQSLSRQLTQPVMYMPAIQRMLGEGFHVFLEVGPNDVLTRMNRDILDSQALSLSLDIPGQTFDDRMLLVHATMECVTGRLSTARFTLDNDGAIRTSPLRRNASTLASSPPVTHLLSATQPAEGAVIDVTRSRRPLRRSSSTSNEEIQPSAEIRSDSTSVPVALPSRPPLAVLPSVPSRAPIPSDSAPKAALVPQVSEVAAQSSPSDAQLRSFVRDLVIELTGYSPEIVDFDADLEADLGVDSIKKAQIMGELGEWLGLTVRPESLRMDSVRTLEDAIRVARALAGEQTPATQDTVTAESDRSFKTVTEPVHIPVAAQEQVVRHNLLPSGDRLDSLLIDYVVDQTGYARDIVDVDADLEADLGLDSIKLAQLIGEMREQFSLESVTLDSIARARFRTLREIREFLISHAQSADQHPHGEPGQKQSGGATAQISPESDDRLLSGQRPSNNGSPAYANGRTSATAAIVASTSVLPRPVESAPGSYSRTEYPSCEMGAVRGHNAVELLTPEWTEWFGVSGLDRQTTETSWQEGMLRGKKYKGQIRAALRSMLSHSAPLVMGYRWTDTESALFRGLASGAGVAEESLKLAATVVRQQHGAGRPGTQTNISTPVRESVSEVQFDGQGKSELSALLPEQTHRYIMRAVQAPRRPGMPLFPELHGAVLILGVNPLSDALAERIQQIGHKVFILSTEGSLDQIELTLQDLWQQTATPHLFLTMSFDTNSTRDLSEITWKQRRAAALSTPFRICQLWMQKTIDAGLMEDASVVSVTQLGGDFGFSGQNVRSIEAIGGLVKAMLIEAWMRGFRTTPMKVIDVTSTMAPQEIASGVLQELAVPSYDMEIAFRSCSGVQEPERFSVQAIAAPLKSESLPVSPSPVATRKRSKLTRGGTWIISGGGRGITAAIAMTLAEKYDLKLHLLGTAPAPQLNDDFVHRVSTDRSNVRRAIMQEASNRGDNPVEAWRNTEKAIEIDATLRECRKQRITATYHRCDVSDFADVETTIQQIRLQAGPISGVIHGAGAGQDARFDRKRPDKVDKCLKAKIDGSLALMQATLQDPLEFFVAFGSISGRFGANGHTDYSLANDMMAKIVDRYRSERPEVCSLTFHWHAWGDIGMATKPEAKLALEMIDMEFMPARDGIDHFMRELELGGNEPEVLITDESYFRKFFPAERLSVTSAGAEKLPLPLISSVVTQHDDQSCSSVVTLNPVTDRFLSQHRVQGRPTLPFVVALELMAEAVRARTGHSSAGLCTEARALQAIRFSTDDPLAVTVQSRPTADGNIECRLLADVRRRDGRMVEEDREYFRAVFSPASGSSDSSRKSVANQQSVFVKPQHAEWKRIEYVSPEGLIYHGPELQELREITDDGQTLFGRIAASAPVQLFGGSRARGFTVPCSTMDACLYAVGYAAWHRHQKPSLPVRFDRIEFGRIPDPGEPCLVRIHQTHLSDSGAVWDFQLQGHNEDRLLTVSGYRIGWLRSS